MDQHLPALTINQWCIREFGTDVPSKIAWPFDKAGRLADNKVQLVPLKELMCHREKEAFNEEEISKNVRKILNIKGANTDSDEKYLKPLWKNGASLYENDDVVNRSLARLLKKELSKQLLELNEITDLVLKKQDKDLYFAARSTKFT